MIGLGVLAAILIIVLVIVLSVYFTVVKKKDNVDASAGSSGGSPTGTGTAPKPTATGKAGNHVTGGDGSTVTLANGTTFTYTNPFGGFWVQDPSNPFNNNAQPNSWTPPLNTSWVWGQNRVYGVNLGGWLVLEPFISPSLYQRYPSAVDEYTLSTLMAADTANGGLKQLEQHYDTFITEQDFAEIAGAGLNWVRLPIPFWAVETWPGEPYLAKTAWTYFLKAVQWARKYGLRIYLDLHTVPGSQNGYNHSGRGGKINFLEGNMGLANAQRTLYYIRVITEFISQPEYQDVIPIFGIVNEAVEQSIGINALTSFYLEAHDMIRNNITGKGAGHGPYIAIHDSFLPGTMWTGYLQGSDRILMDTHPYFSFTGEANPQPLDVNGAQGQPGGQWPAEARQNFGVSVGGEFSGSPNDCGLFVLGVTGTALTPGCDTYDNWASYTAAMKAGVQNFIEAQFDALGDWFFWTWKIGASQVSGNIEAPLWSYQLGYRNGWIPTDPRVAVGKCASLSAPAGSFSAYLPWQTGTPSTIPASSTASFPWPPTTLNNLDVAMTLLPTYTNTAPLITMPPQSFSGAPAQVTKSVDGWFNAQDTDKGVTAVSGCTYPDEYIATFAVVPTAACTGT
ncbi:glycoside hydrolase family 5 protein [Laccaria bicolor S238N-H82]|uniref:glucan 1,3-beta-glucosidase n=1 Tax=Laccaria bicolor (strain S238N-H82 / ATCC MYA-4686) TaxID=486041 RepID=B0DFS4_LACBS|nr:glycoside hydrolase family 5 protein [Laccaria bicolor S238N-H82]EDR06394.1 glycoside hydrolase family 5 protein [Laccaria bicolor S238N-H82]|eukprot:XP_001882766.1 glycoside hydrolase family 5 protein [Laccaria bicolor S238N-H82]